MGHCVYRVVCGGLLVAQLACGGDSASGGRGGVAVPGDEPGEEPALDEPRAPGEPLTPREGDRLATGEPPAAGEEELPAASGPPPFNDAEGDTCSIDIEFHVDTPLDDTRGTGFSALDMLAIFNAQGPGTLTWLDGTTTTLSIVARVAGNTSEVDDPPRGEGHCAPFREVPVELRVESADGRLAEDVTSELVAIGYDGNIRALWIGEGGLPLDELQGGLEVPSDWLIAGHTERRLDFDTSWTPPGALGPFCTSSDVPSTDASESCNVYTGVVRFVSLTPFTIPSEDVPGAVMVNPVTDYFSGALGSWVLAR